VSRVSKSGLAAVKFDVDLADQHDHERGNARGRRRTDGHPHHRNLSDIVKIIDASGLSRTVREKSKAVFRRLAEAKQGAQVRGG